MQEFITVTGMVLKDEPIGEYDRRVVILTTDMGKISCFAKGARKVNSRLMAATNPFCFGEFKLYAGRNSYSLNDAHIQNYFESLRTDYEGALYGMYFLEVADYYTRENNDDKEMLKLLYQSVRALENGNIPNPLVRYIFEIKSVVINGEYPGIPDKNVGVYDESTVYAVDHIVSSGVEKLYTFTVSESVLSELKSIASYLMGHFTDRKFKSTEILNEM